MNIRIGRVRILSNDTYEVMMSMLDRLQRQHDSFCAEIEAGHQVEAASEFLRPYEAALSEDGDRYPMPHEVVTEGDMSFLGVLNVKY